MKRRGTHRRSEETDSDSDDEDTGVWKAPIVYMLLGSVAGWLITYAYYAPKTGAPQLKTGA